MLISAIFTQVMSMLTIIYMFDIFVLIERIMHIVSYFRINRNNMQYKY